MKTAPTVSRRQPLTGKGLKHRRSKRGITARTAAVKLWLSAEEHALIARAASRLGVSAAAFVRETAIAKVLGFQCLNVPAIDTAEGHARANRER